MDDRALATVLAEGHPDGSLALHDAHADGLYDYASELLGSADAAIGAIRDALLVAQERADALTDESRLVAWLYALTRNECVRRLRHGTAVDLDRELLTLVRHRLGTADIAVVLGLSADDATHRLRVARATGASAAAEAAAGAELPPAPPALREQLVAGSAADAAEYRAALVRRAGPFGPDGFPQPVDQRRIGGYALAWCTAAAVLIALAVLVMLPGDGSSAGGTALAALPGGVPAGAPELTGTAQPPFATRDAWPLPAADTLHAPSIAAPPARSSAGGAVPPANPAPPASATPATAAPPATTQPPVGAAGADGSGQPADNATVASWFQNRTAPACQPAWTARVHAMVFGADPATVSQVTGTWADAGQSHPVALSRDGREWVATVVGLPTGREVVLTLRASTARGPVTGQPLRLLYRCS